MAEIRPLRAFRYNQNLTHQLEELVSPLFDVVSEKQRKRLYQEKYNSIHLSVPQGPAPIQHAANTLTEWKKDKVIVQDDLPAIYVYYQYFSLPGSAKTFCRKGFVANMRIYDWDEKILLRHENTIPKAVNDRTDILEATQLHVSPTHGLYTDELKELEVYMDEAISNSLYETEDYQGVRDVLASIQDAKVIRKFIDVLKHKQIILADGHHRYEGSLAYMKKMREQNAEHTGNEGYNFHLMYFTNTVSDDIRILPTHRLIKSLNGNTEESILQQLEKDFIIKPIEDPDVLPEIIAGKPWAFGMIFKNNAYKVRLRPENLEKIKWNFPQVIKSLDLTVMHYFIIEQALGIPAKEQRSSENISFDRSFADCLTKVLKDEAALAIITQEISIDTVKNVCESGYTLPQKSTYFYPKVICGFLFGSIKADEFNTPDYSCF
ncbi:MAG TPA: DUF1015 domain-containing protein [Cyclobacteriaceae bacterium]|nr:DUF1015 domain-containing protein [Cyclobacteriaceae bacterium]